MPSIEKSVKTIDSRLLLILVFVASALTSPKWNIALAPWVAYTLSIHYFRLNKGFKSILLFWLISYLAALIASYKVVPMPLPILLVFSLVSTGFLLVPYLLDRWLHKRLNSFLNTLVFPSTMVLFDFLASQGGGGTWGNVAYLQFSNLYLMQWASVTGIWGISFLVYWFASCANFWFENRASSNVLKKILQFYGIPFLLIIGFGMVRLNVFSQQSDKTVKVAGITTENLSIIETLYECEYGKKIKIPPTAFQSDPEFAEAFATMGIFIQDPYADKFQPVFSEIDTILNRLWDSSYKAVKEGAKIISWTEGIVGVLKPEEQKYIAKAQSFARENGIWFFFPMASLIPGEIIPGEPFMENKVLTINPSGEIVNTYFKSIPVGGVEPCFPGDGNIPLIRTEYGNFSPVICYDADFPDLLKQVGKQATEVLVVPSGDWEAISPIHSYMAIVRAIENGVSILRPVSKGLSIAADNYGRIISKNDYFTDENHLLIAEIPIQKVKTIYSLIGDAFVYICMFVLGLLLVVGMLPSKFNLR